MQAGAVCSGQDRCFCFRLFRGTCLEMNSVIQFRKNIKGEQTQTSTIFCSATFWIILNKKTDAHLVFTILLKQVSNISESLVTGTGRRPFVMYCINSTNPINQSMIFAQQSAMMGTFSLTKYRKKLQKETAYLFQCQSDQA